MVRIRSFLPALALVLGCCLLCALPARAAEPPRPKRLVMTELKPGGLKPDLVRTLTDVLLEALRARSGMRVMGRTEVEVILEHEGQKQLMGCDDEGCEANLGQALKADYLCSGSLGVIGTTFLVNLALTDFATARVTARSSATAMSETELVAAVQRAAEDLVAPSDRRKAKATQEATGFKLTGKTSLAMLDLTASGLEPQVVDNLTQVVVDELKNLPKASLISRYEIRALFSHTRQQQLLGCDDAGCLSELGGALGVDYLVSGNVGRVGDTYLLHLKLISIKGAKIANRVAESFVGEESQLIGATRFAARGLVGLRREGDGKLEVPKPVSDARLIVDGKPLEGAASTVQSLKAGKYNLRLEADGFAPWFSDVYVDAGALTRVNATMKELGTPVYKKWWLWTLVGVVVAGGAATAAVLATQQAGGSGQTYPFNFETGLPQR